MQPRELPVSDASPIVVRRSRLSSVEAFAKDAWNAVVSRSATATVFQTWEWHAAWWRALGRDAELLLLVAEHAGTPVGIAPLLVRQLRDWRGTHRAVEWIGAPHADYCDLIVDAAHPEAAQALLGWLTDNPREWDTVHFHNTPADAAALEALAHVLPQPCFPARRLASVAAPTRALSSPEADRKAFDKKSLRPLLNGFRRDGQVNFEHLTGATEIQPLLDTLFQQHIARWAGTPTPSPFVDDTERDFYRALIDAFNATGMLVFSAMIFDDHPVACHLGFEFRGRFHYYKPTYDLAHQRRSPGALLLKALLDRALDRRLDTFDFGVGDEAYKFRFANQVRHCEHLRIYRHHLPYLTHRTWATLKEVALRSPTLVGIGRKVRKVARGPFENAP